MTIRFQCPNGHSLQVSPDLAGKRGACPECGVKVQVPAPTPRAPAAETVEAAETTTPPAGAEPAPLAGKETERPTTDETVANRPAARAVARAVAKPKAAPPPPPPVSAAGPWHLRTPAGEQFGPATDDQFRQWITDHRVAPDSYVWREGWAEWRLASEASDTLPAPLPPSPPAAAAAPSGAPTAASRYADRRRRESTMRTLTAGVLLVMTLALGGVLVWVLKGANLGDAEQEPAPPTAIDAQPPPAKDEAPAEQPPAD